MGELYPHYTFCFQLNLNYQIILGGMRGITKPAGTILINFFIRSRWGRTRDIKLPVKHCSWLEASLWEEQGTAGRNLTKLSPQPRQTIVYLSTLANPYELSVVIFSKALFSYSHLFPNVAEKSLDNLWSSTSGYKDMKIWK